MLLTKSVQPLKDVIASMLEEENFLPYLHSLFVKTYANKDIKDVNVAMRYNIWYSIRLAKRDEIMDISMADQDSDRKEPNDDNINAMLNSALRGVRLAQLECMAKSSVEPYSLICFYSGDTPYRILDSVNRNKDECKKAIAQLDLDGEGMGTNDEGENWFIGFGNKESYAL